MKIRTGADVEEVSRFSYLIEKNSFFDRIYTEEERQHILSSGHAEQSAAGIYCAKEAISKALGRGLYGLIPQELGVVWDAKGAPAVCLTGSAAEQYRHLQFSLSISHTKTTAFAVCTVLEE